MRGGEGLWDGSFFASGDRQGTEMHEVEVPHRLPGSPPRAELPAPDQRDLPGSDVGPSGALDLPPAFTLGEVGEGLNRGSPWVWKLGVS